MTSKISGSSVRQSFIDFFVKKKAHTFVPSSSLVPGGDQTLLFTNAGMVQFKDVFLGTDLRPYNRAANSQKCMRVAGKHNDLDDVGRDDTHHTFFEMLGNWSFGDYYKKEAIAWAWELLTEEWGLDKTRLWTTCFKDDKGNIPADDEAAVFWRQQPGINPDHVLYFGRKENFWEMADTGPCGPCSEIHIDQGEEFCDKKGEPGHVCSVNGDCKRFLELWNLVFIQYNRLGPDNLEPLKSCHVDTGMGMERIVAVLQGVNSNYKTDLLLPLIQKVQKLAGKTDAEREAHITPYRVIADHSRSAAFLIADGVVPGNTGRNYICRMIIRRASRFGGKLGLNEPFLAQISEEVINHYGDAYPELLKTKKTILDSITAEEERFHKTLESGLSYLNELLEDLKNHHQTTLDGKAAFDLYATHGLPLEISRDIAREQNMDVDETGFREAMEEHKLNSGGGKAFGPLGGEDADFFKDVFSKLIKEKKLDEKGVLYDPYNSQDIEGELLGIICNGGMVESAHPGDEVEIILPRTNFYIESGGQVSDSGVIQSLKEGEWVVEISEVRKPSAGIITHIGKVIKGMPKIGSKALAVVDWQRRKDTQRNHTATHLLHAQLHKVLGEHARQAGSLVSPERLRFDFNHPEAISAEQLAKIEEGVNLDILNHHDLNVVTKSLNEAISEGVTALFGEKYGEVVRTITIGPDAPISYELCGGTHVENTSDIGLFIITSEGSAAAGVRRIEAVTGREAYKLVQKRMKALSTAAGLLGGSQEDLPAQVEALKEKFDLATKENTELRQKLVFSSLKDQLENVPVLHGVPVLVAQLPEADASILRQMTDRFREKYPSGVTVVGSVFEGKPTIIASVTDDLTKKGIHAGELVKAAAQQMEGSGGGRPNLAQAGGKNAERLPNALKIAHDWLNDKLAKG